MLKQNVKVGERLSHPTNHCVATSTTVAICSIITWNMVTIFAECCERSRYIAAIYTVNVCSASIAFFEIFTNRLWSIDSLVVHGLKHVVS